MTYKELTKLFKQYNIPTDVVLMSDSGRECGATEMNGVYYNKEQNVIVFRQSGDDFYTQYETRYIEKNGWILLK